MSDHDTFHTAESKGGSCTCVHWPDVASRVQMSTRPSCEHEATTEAGEEAIGAHATSRTQSVCSASVATSDHSCVAGSCRQTLTRLSHPPVTSCALVESCLLAEATRAAGSYAGAHDTPFTPIWCAPILVAVHESSAWCVRIVTRVSADAHARTRPSSAGAHARALTDESWPSYTYTRTQ